MHSLKVDVLDLTHLLSGFENRARHSQVLGLRGIGILIAGARRTPVRFHPRGCVSPLLEEEE